MGLSVVPGVGTPFDPEIHEAILREPSADVPDGTVLQVRRAVCSTAGSSALLGRWGVPSTYARLVAAWVDGSLHLQCVACMGVP
jgi:GrpE